MTAFAWYLARMSGDSRIISFGSGNTTDASASQARSDTEAFPQPGLVPDDGTDHSLPSSEQDSDWDQAWVSGTDASASEWDAPASRGWVAPVLASLAIMGWTGLFVIAHWPALLAGPALPYVAALITQWCVPVLLIGLAWLLALRHSAREGKRFGDVARSLSMESALLEQRLTGVNRELSLAREFVASQARDLETLGRLAAERLSGNAQRLQELVEQNGERVETIGTVSAAALDNMEKLRGQLPVIASSAKDITNNIANAGRTAHAQIEDMISGFNRLNEFGLASERQVSNLRVAVDAALAQFAGQCEDLDVIARERFAALADQGAQFRTELEQHEVNALASVRSRAAALQEELRTTRDQLDENEAQSLTSLRARLASLRDECGVVARVIAEGQRLAQEELRSGFDALTQEQAGARQRLTSEHEAIIAALAERLTTLDRAASETEERIALAQQDTIAAIERRLAALADQADLNQTRLHERATRLAGELEEREARQRDQERHAVSRIESMLAELDGAIAERLERHRHQADILSERTRTVTAHMEQAEARLRSIATQSADSEARLLASLSALSENLAQSRAALASTDGDVVRLTDDSVRLLELLQAGTRLVNGDLSAAMAQSQDRLNQLDAGLARVLGLLGDASANGAALAGSLDSSDNALGLLNDKLTAAQAALSQSNAHHAAQLTHLGETLAEVETALERNADKARIELADAVRVLNETLQEAIGAIETEAPVRITNVSRALGEASGVAIDKAMRTTIAEISGQLEQAVAHASGVSREATAQLHQQLDNVADLVASLEARLDSAREKASEQVNNDFARRAALITESLNSNAIDIAAALSSEVSDTAWAAYLRGDRGIFTRRAVSLIDTGEAKAIQQAYERDDAFREHVSRYIHDFESLLRQVLSTRDGNAMGVTLLSSDMGKLYVALAQGIERLRA